MDVERATDHLLKLHARAEERMRQHDKEIAALIRVAAHNNNQITGLLAATRALQQDQRASKEDTRAFKEEMRAWTRESRQEMRELRKLSAAWLRGPNGSRRA